MTTKPVIPREAARRDVEAAIDFYAREAREGIDLRFIDAVQRLRDLLIEGAASPPGGPADQGYFDELRTRVGGRKGG